MKLINLTRDPIEIIKDCEVILIVEPDGRLHYILMRENVRENILITTPDDEHYEIPCRNSIVVGDIVLSNDIELGDFEDLPSYQEDILYMVGFDIVTSSPRNDFVWATNIDTNTFFYRQIKK